MWNILNEMKPLKSNTLHRHTIQKHANYQVNATAKSKGYQVKVS